MACSYWPFLSRLTVTNVCLSLFRCLFITEASLLAGQLKFVYFLTSVLVISLIETLFRISPIHINWIPAHNGMELPRVAVEEEGLQT